MATKYIYYKVIQEGYGTGCGWEDVDHHECDSTFFPKDHKAFRYNLKAYKRCSTARIRVIHRRELRECQLQN